MVDFPGTLAAVMFTSGCNFTCGFCHNSTLMSQRREGMTWDKLKTGCQEFRDQWVKAISITGGEPTLWGNELIHLVKFLKQQGFKVKVDTNGSRPGEVAKLISVADYIAMDIKCAPSSYEEFVDFKKSQWITDSVDIIRSSSVPHEFRTTVVESYHTDEQMLAIKALVDGAQRYALQPFIPREDLPGEPFRTMFRTSSARMQEILALMEGCADTVELRGN